VSQLPQKETNSAPSFTKQLAQSSQIGQVDTHELGLWLKVS
jgi:hypothetical protein